MIVFDYSKVMGQVRELRRIADDMKMASNRKLRAAINSVEGSWNGETGQMFLKNCSLIEARVNKEVSMIRELADKYEDSARKIEKTEKTATAVAANK